MVLVNGAALYGRALTVGRLAFAHVSASTASSTAASGAATGATAARARVRLKHHDAGLSSARLGGRVVEAGGAGRVPATTYSSAPCTCELPIDPSPRSLHAAARAAKRARKAAGAVTPVRGASSFVKATERFGEGARKLSGDQIELSFGERSEEKFVLSRQHVALRLALTSFDSEARQCVLANLHETLATKAGDSTALWSVECDSPGSVLLTARSEEVIVDAARQAIKASFELAGTRRAASTAPKGAESAVVQGDAAAASTTSTAAAGQGAAPGDGAKAEKESKKQAFMNVLASTQAVPAPRSTAVDSPTQPGARRLYERIHALLPTAKAEAERGLHASERGGADYTALMERFERKTPLGRLPGSALSRQYYERHLRNGSSLADGDAKDNVAFTDAMLGALRAAYPTAASHERHLRAQNSLSKLLNEHFSNGMHTLGRGKKQRVPQNLQFGGLEAFGSTRTGLNLRQSDVDVRLLMLSDSEMFGAQVSHPVFRVSPAARIA